MTESVRLTPKQIADRLGFGLATVYRLLETGVIPGIQIGTGQRNRWLVTRAAYMEWEASARTKAA